MADCEVKALLQAPLASPQRGQCPRRGKGETKEGTSELNRIRWDRKRGRRASAEQIPAAKLIIEHQLIVQSKMPGVYSSCIATGILMGQGLATKTPHPEVSSPYAFTLSLKQRRFVDMAIEDIQNLLTSEESNLGGITFENGSQIDSEDKTNYN
ncbi:hypothetical protein TNCV_3512251 [Trichonephila clavipes]|nr:hypothetical protein TNCV_3512251 [Trichonephila clavipes]